MNNGKYCPVKILRQKVYLYENQSSHHIIAYTSDSNWKNLMGNLSVFAIWYQ